MSDDIYRIKNVVFNNKTVPILMQNINGPCPLLAISELSYQGVISSRIFSRSPPPDKQCRLAVDLVEIAFLRFPDSAPCVLHMKTFHRLAIPFLRGSDGCVKFLWVRARQCAAAAGEDPNPFGPGVHRLLAAAPARGRLPRRVEPSPRRRSHAGVL